MKVHQLKIDFSVTERVKRFVYVYIIEAENCYLIDSGVFGCENQIVDYLAKIGRKPEDVKGVFLTHAHPDHIGSAAWWQEHIGCKIYASEGEKRWIEDIDLQFKERPIPNFYQLAGKSFRVDVPLKDGDIIDLEPNLEIKAIRTAGHSADCFSYLTQNALFIGDAVPVKGDIPIFIDEKETRITLNIIGRIPDIDVYCPAWDKTYDRKMMRIKLNEAEELINTLKKAVRTCDNDGDIAELVNQVCDNLKMPMLKENPLFLKMVECLREK
ncbi:MAG: MBL fold metallo-hydrolase [Ruminococcus sp.]|nr:MBL fold metallo-hydrolase [Ruminococcus sp.]